ncbi:hypothetical protein [Streptomyces violaceorubidus]|uniref:hypothetical protein n=1 Tax=Streptomyces violaceorubidus TaxID=284042 RepID=UPI000A74C688|nr:hypothetical protein [Streptomyces violaceorubidus]
MTLADRQAAALAALTRRQPPAELYPGETRPSGDMPVDWREALAWLNARDRLEGTGQ